MKRVNEATIALYSCKNAIKKRWRLNPYVIHTTDIHSREDWESEAVAKPGSIDFFTDGSFNQRTHRMDEE